LKERQRKSSSTSFGSDGLRSVKLPRPQAGASREGNIVLIVPLNPAYKAGLAGHLPVKSNGRTLANLSSMVGKLALLRTMKTSDPPEGVKKSGDNFLHTLPLARGERGRITTPISYRALPPAFPIFGHFRSSFRPENPHRPPHNDLSPPWDLPQRSCRK
jgi:hypothetical protein